MDISSLKSDGESQCSQMIPLVSTNSMGDQQVSDIEGVDSRQFHTPSSKMAATINDNSSKNYLDYHNNLLLGSRDLNLTNQLFSTSTNNKSSQDCLTEKSNGRMEDSNSDQDEPVDCDNCEREFSNLQQFMDHQCRLKEKKVNNIKSESDYSDAESFNGKIVYNPDGSAYIIEESESSDNDSPDIPQQDGAIVDDKGTLISSSPAVFPQIANAFFVPRNPGSLFDSQSTLFPRKQQTPIMHSYRVYDVHTKDNNNDTKSESEYENGPTVPTKPILMCFICRLSFGQVKSFHSHAANEHAMKLSENEVKILNSKNSSAIIQGVGKDKHPLMSFLEPVLSPNTDNVVSSKSSSVKPKSISESFPTSLNSTMFKDNLQYSNLWSLNGPKTCVDMRHDEDNNNIPGNIDSESEDECDFNSRLVINTSATSPACTNSLSINSIMERKGSPKSSSETPLHSSPLPLPQPTFLGMCDEHPQGRLQGVECPKCDIVLSSSQSLGGHMTMMHSRNSCKTLKCPKCNWHYKYQETLDIHMKEKHPENDAQCIYCLSNQSHPRLARGETYSCGYKPYRCEVCNYSTTTKGNLSIHMQSDKHINNMQDLANGSTEMKMPPAAPPTPTTSTTTATVPPSFPPDESQMKKLQKPKQTWRCDVCNYETTVARNLRIHMTSEKHTHNMMVLQQNMKHMQQDMHMQMNQLMMLGQQDPSMFTSLPTTMGGGMYPYDQSMMLAAGMPPGFELPVNLTKENGNPMEIDEIPDAAKLFHCCVCNNFTTDSLEALHQHLQLDRTKQQENEHVTVAGGTYLCNLCQYKTNLKANFQLHSKTDKHIQRLQLVNHIKEGGVGNEWRLKYLNVSNPIQVRCNSCDYYTNSIHKLNVHTTNLQHESSAQLFRHIQYEEAKLNSSSKYYHCAICQYSTKVKLNLIHHVQSVQHLQNDAAYKNRAKEDGGQTLDIDQIFQVRQLKDDDDVDFDEDEEGDTPENGKTDSEIPVDIKIEGSSTLHSSPTPTATITKSTESSDGNLRNEVKINRSDNEAVIKVKQYNCPLCQDECVEISGLKSHLLQAHNVKQEGLDRILLIAEQTESDVYKLLSTKPQEKSSSVMPNVDKELDINWNILEADHAKLIKDEAVDTSMVSDKNEDGQYRCQTCSSAFANIDQLYAHQNELGHLELKQTPRGPGYLCWKKGCNQYFKTAQALQVHFREIHARRNIIGDVSFSCSQCSLVFQSEEKLAIHDQYHLVKSATSCPVCTASMKGVQQTFEHLDSAHGDLEKEELEKHLSDLNNKAYALFSNPGFDKYLVKTSANNSKNGVHENCIRKDEEGEDFSSCEDEENDALNNSANLEDSLDHSNVDGEKSDAYKEQQFMEDYMNSQAIAEGNYEDPNRKFKCHRCRVAFTKQNYLTSHNKTLQHRKGEKSVYPVDRYLDPNRPFKCDVCKESFTQKSILLVHYNSVSHLHKLKQAAHTGSLPTSTSALSTTQTTSAVSTSLDSSPPSTAISTNSSSTVPSSSTSTSSTASSSQDSGRKPYRCNICRVAYNQGATLDIHIRSVAHQTRASKIHELAMTGRIDITLPLIENPDLGKVSTQQAQAITDMISQTQAKVSVSNIQQNSLLFPGMPTLPMMSGLNMLAHASDLAPSPGLTSGLPLSTTSSTSIVSMSKSTKPHTTSITTSADGEDGNRLLHQTQVKEEKKIKVENKDVDMKEMEQLNDSDLFPGTGLVCPKCQSSFATPEALLQHQKIYCYLGSHAALARPRNIYGRFKPQIQKNLLENIGFECVMQFNENLLRPVKKEIEEHAEIHKDEVGDTNPEEMDTSEKKEETVNKKKQIDMPEMNRSHCSKCSKDFSSVWVLKTHQEEVHKTLVPIELVETFGSQFKKEFELKESKEIEPPLTPQASSEKTIQPEMPPPPPPSASQLQNQFDISQLMPMFGMMPMPLSMMQLGMPSHMMPMMLPGMDVSNFMPPMPVMDPNFASAQQQIQHQAAAAAAAAANQKRVRTRISDDQLKILRAHFDITNSPSDDQIKQMSDQSGLPQKVIKHWFRNTLFKERQRNKDSPYNFNNPPSTSIDLDEYEKTGKIPDIKQEPSDDEDNEDIDMEPEKDRYDLIYKPEQPKLTIVEDRREYDCRSNASTPSTTSSIPSTPTTSVPNTPTPAYAAYYDDLSHSSFDHSSMQSSSFRRANRTRFTDYQIKMLQDYFEQNAYPKDDELEHLSKMLSLSPRVIVVWFQNARQKARKIYENQPAAEVKEPASVFQRTPGLNYQCKKCSAVFQRYYELIKHQKRMCGSDQKNNNNNSNNHQSTSSRNQSSSSSGHSSGNNMAAYNSTYDEGFDDDEETDSDCHSPNGDTNLSSYADDSACATSVSQLPTFHCDKCDASFNRLSLWQEHQQIHNVNPSLFPGFGSNSAFDVLQTLAHHEGNSALKRKFDSEDDSDQPRDKRLRTTILPEQLDYLYQKYQLDCNPSRKQLENISREVGLKKRVVQVWFQNTRARERKGQYRAHQQIIHKRCPFCRALFRAKSALESHLATKHPEEMAKKDFNIDTIPDASLDTSPTTPQSLPGSLPTTPNSSHDLNKILPPGMPNYLQFMPQPGMGFSPGSDSVQMSMHQLYEDSFKRYINDLSSTPKHAHALSENKGSSKRSETESRSNAENDAPLDLSKPIKIDIHDKTSDGPSTDMSAFSFEDHFGKRRRSFDESISDTMSEAAGDHNDDMSSMVSNPTSPSNSHINKRYRTQMTSIQVRVMKILFQDYKTPTMAECELLGREIGLPKRVIQVWFQNARAKEKKSKMNLPKGYGEDNPKTPEKCSLCSFKYSHKFTVQDHIFTRKHIDNVRKHIHSQGDSDVSEPSDILPMIRQHRDMDRMRKSFDESAPTSHLAQLQAMGLNAMNHQGTNSPSASMVKVKSEKKETKSENAPTKEQAAEMAMNAQMMSALGGYLPGMDPNFLSYMYSGMPGFFPGLGMPMVQPGGMFPGAEHMMAYDPIAFGTPLSLLQIPQQAIKIVGEKLADPKSTRAQYTQDCKKLSELKTMISSTDYRLVHETIIDVGYICKKCQMVYPAKDACVNHQQSLCFLGSKIPENVQPMLKLEQIQYECKPCGEKVSALFEMKVHCQLDTHKIKLAKYIKRKSSSGTLPVSVASSSSPNKHRSTPIHDNLNNFQNSVSAESPATQPKIE